MGAIAKITAVNGWMLATLGVLAVFLVLTLLLVLIVVLVNYTTRREEGSAARAQVPTGMRVLGDSAWHGAGEGDALSKDYKTFLASLKRQ